MRKKQKKQTKPDKKCIVAGCSNRPSEGKFVGDLCAPCHAFVALGAGEFSQAYRNALGVVGRQLAQKAYRDVFFMVRSLDPTRGVVAVGGPTISDQALRDLVSRGKK